MARKAKVYEVDNVVIKFSGDSGDGMQLTGTQFSDTASRDGDDVSTFPDYPAEIRAPQGTVGGVSGFQLHFGSDIDTPGDYADVLVAMNPASIKANKRWLKPGATIIYDSDSFTPQFIKKAGYIENPIEEEGLSNYNLIKAPISTLTQENLKDLGLDRKSILRCKNMFALGMVYWIFDRPMTYTEEFVEKKFKSMPAIVEANKRALKAGYYYAETIDAMPSFRIHQAKVKKGRYRNINGNIATAWGLIAAAEKAGLQLFCGSYPITPATEILQELSLRKDLGVKTFQAEDEIAGICTAIGASFAGALAVTTTSGPGLALKGEAIGLAVITELPLVIVNVQRGGPSTGLPTKTEQGDLMQALFGRNGESPVVVLAASTPSNCFSFAYEAAKIAIEYMTPVILLTDGFIANGSQLWKYPKMADLPTITPPFAKEGEHFQPYLRDEETYARKWAIPGVKGLEHRIGGLEKTAITGTVSYIPENHQVMVNEREEKIQRVQKVVPPLKVEGNKSGDVLIVGWGSTYGHLRTAFKELQSEGCDVSLVHFTHINPLPANVAVIFSRFKRIVICELNMGQFANYLRMKFPQFYYHQYNKVQGLPFTVVELKEHVKNLIKLR